MPSWMAALHKSFNDGRTHKNIRLFIARLIVNRSKVFQPFARFWLVPLAQLVVGGDSGGVGIHYFVVDVMVTILSWSTTAVLEVGWLIFILFTFILPLYLSCYLFLSSLPSLPPPLPFPLLSGCVSC